MLLAIPSAIGGLLGSMLVLALPARSFELAEAWLILFAVGLYAAARMLAR